MRFHFSRTTSPPAPPLPLSLLISIAIAAVLSIGTSIIADAQGSMFWMLLLQYDQPMAWGFVALLAITLLTIRHAQSYFQEWSLHFERYLLLLCIGTFTLLVVAALIVTQKVALSMDEYSVLLQSQIFAKGHLAGHMPPDVLERAVPLSFRGWFIHVALERGELASTYLPGCALLMAPFAKLHVPWAFNPAITALSIGVMWHVSYQLFASEVATENSNIDTRIWARQGAAWSTLLLACSPVVFMNALGYYTMPTHLLANLIFCGALLRGTRSAAFGAGILGGFALCLHNPVPHALFALPFFLWLVCFRRDLALPLALGYLIFLPLLYFGWHHFLQNFDIPTSQLPATALPAGVTIGENKPFSWPTPIMLLARVGGLFKLWLWGVPSLFMLAPKGWKTYCEWKHGKPKSDSTIVPLVPVFLLSGYALVLTFTLYIFVTFDQGHGWGFRYLHQLYFVFPWFAARFLLSTKNDKSSSSQLLNTQMVWLCVLSLVVLIPFRSWQTHQLIASHQAQIVEPPPNTPGIVFINSQKGFYTSDLIQNDPFALNPVWHLESRSTTENSTLAKRYLKDARLWNKGTLSETWVGTALSPTPLKTTSAK